LRGGAVITLALAIGREYRYFQRVQCVLFKPLPYAEPDRIVMLWERQPDGTMGDVAPANFVDWQDGSRSFSGTAAVRTSSFAPSFIHGGQGNASRLVGGAVSSGFFSVLGVRFMLGRNFLPDMRPTGHNRVAILSYAAWKDGSARTATSRQDHHAGRQKLHGGRCVAGEFSNSGARRQISPASDQPDIWVRSRSILRNCTATRIFCASSQGLSPE